MSTSPENALTLHSLGKIGKELVGQFLGGAVDQGHCLGATGGIAFEQAANRTGDREAAGLADAADPRVCHRTADEGEITRAGQADVGDELASAAQVAIILFAGAYLAEIVRGGLQAIPRGQTEAADALGLSYFQRTRLIVLPQALAMVIPPLVNSFISMFKDTSLVIIVSLFDLLGATEFALTDANWQGFYVEADVFIAVIYWSFCFFMSRYSQMLEREFYRGNRR